MLPTIRRALALIVLVCFAGLASAQQMEHYKPRWTWPGSTGPTPAASLRHHLETTHGQNLAGLSDVQAAKLHDQLHGGRTSTSWTTGTTRPAAPAAPVRRVLPAASNCPGGNCPTGTGPVRWLPWRR